MGVILSVDDVSATVVCKKGGWLGCAPGPFPDSIDESKRRRVESFSTHSHLKMASRFLECVYICVCVCVCLCSVLCVFGRTWRFLSWFDADAICRRSTSREGGGEQVVRWGGQGGGGCSRRWRDNVDSSFCLMWLVSFHQSQSSSHHFSFGILFCGNIFFNFSYLFEA